MQPQQCKPGYACWGQGTVFSSEQEMMDAWNANFGPDPVYTDQTAPSTPNVQQTTTAAPVEEDSDPGAYYEPEEEEDETKPPETQKPKNILSQSDLIDGVPNWVFIALLLCCSCTFMMFILLMLK